MPTGVPTATRDKRQRKRIISEHHDNSPQAFSWTIPGQRDCICLKDMPKEPGRENTMSRRISSFAIAVAAFLWGLVGFRAETHASGEGRTLAEWRTEQALEGMQAVEGRAKVTRETRETLWQVLLETTGLETVQTGRPRLAGTNEWGGTYDLPFETPDGTEQHLGVFLGEGDTRAVYRTAERDEGMSNSMAADAELFLFRWFDGGIPDTTAVLSPRELLDGNASRVVEAFSSAELNVPFERYWFFFLDDMPAADWMHPARCVFIKDDLSAVVVHYGNQPVELYTGSRHVDLVEVEEIPGTHQSRPRKHAIHPVASKNGSSKTAFTPLGGGDASHCYALLVSGGGNIGNNHGRYWNEICFVYNVLRKRYGLPRANIKVLWGNGNPANDLCWKNIKCNDCSGWSFPSTDLSDFDQDKNSDITGAATLANFKSVLANYKTTLQSTDQLLIFVTDHGGVYKSKTVHEPSTFVLWGHDPDNPEKTDMIDTNLATLTSEIKCPVMLAMKTCYSGGMNEEFVSSAKNRIAAASDGYDPSAAHPLMGQWTYNFFGALCGYFPAGSYKTSIDPRNMGQACNADMDGDGRVSFWEAHQFAYNNNPWTAANGESGYYIEIPEYDESTPNLGKKLFLTQYADAPAVVVKEKVTTPVLNPANGSVGYAPGVVTASCGTAGATIRYTLDGSEPTEKSAVAEGGTIMLTADKTVKVRAFKSGMEGSATATGKYTITKSAPQKATIMSVSQGDASSGIVLNWVSGAGTTGFNILRSESSSMSSSKTVASGLAATATSWADLSADIGKIYYFQVQSTNSYGKTNSAVSQGAWVALPAPSGVAAKATVVKLGSANIEVSWKAVTGATHYRVWRANADGSRTAVSGWITGVAFTNTVTLSGGTQIFRYQVQAASSSSGATPGGYSSYAEVAVSPDDVKGTLIVNSVWWRIEMKDDQGGMSVKPGATATYSVGLLYDDGTLETSFVKSPTWTVVSGSGLTLTGAPGSGGLTYRPPEVTLAVGSGVSEQIAKVRASVTISGVTFSRELPVYISQNGIVEKLGIGTYPCIAAGETLELSAGAYMYGVSWSQDLPVDMEVEWSIVGGSGATISDDGELTAWSVNKLTNVLVQAKAETAFGPVFGHARLNVVPASSIKKQTAVVPPTGGYSTNLVGIINQTISYCCTSNSWITGYAYHWGGSTTNPAQAGSTAKMRYGWSSMGISGYVFISFKADRNPGKDRETFTKIRWSDGGIDFRVVQQEAPYAQNPKLTGGANGVVSATAATDGGIFHYALDGEEPSGTSPVMSGKLEFDESTVVAVKAYGEWLQASGTAYADVTGKNSVWDEVKVTFVPGKSGVTTPAARTYKVNETFGELPTFAKTGGLYFKGWTLQEGSERVVKADESVPGMDSKLYGVWSETSEAKPEWTALPWNFKSWMTAMMVVSNADTHALMGPEECSIGIVDSQGVCRGSSDNGFGGVESELHGKNGLHVFGVYSDTESGTEGGLTIKVWVKGKGYATVGNPSFVFTPGGTEGSEGSPKVVRIGKGNGWYKIAFAAGTGGTGSMTPMDAEVGSTVTLPDCGFARDKYRFAGWGKSVEGGVVYAAGWTGKLTNASGKTPADGETVTLYAQWTPTTYNVTLDLQGGTGGTTNATATYGKAMPKITVPKKEGYAFEGYYALGGAQYYKADGTSAHVWDLTADTKLYAKWTPATYKVTLDLQGGTGGTTNATATYGKAMPKITVPKKEGYAFEGYYALGGAQYYKADGTSAHVWDLTSDAKLYAKWTPTQNVSQGPAISGMKFNASGKPSCILFAGVAGTEYEIQWTPSLLEGWRTRKRWKADSEAETEIPVTVPSTTQQGFFRIVTVTESASAGTE